VESLHEMEKTIYEMRQTLYMKIDEKNNLLDVDVIVASKNLDIVLNEYNKLLKEVV